MAELLLKRKKGNDQPPAEVFELQAVPTLIFQTAHEITPYLFDLTVFANGVTAEEIAQRKGSGKRMSPIGGRPQLIRELLPHIRDLYSASPAITCIGLVDSL